MRIKALSLIILLWGLSGGIVLAACSDKNPLSEPGKNELPVEDSDEKSQDNPSDNGVGTVPSKSVEAIRVLEYLKSIYGKQILSGTMSNVSWNFKEAEWVYHHTGRWPAIAFMDYISLASSPSSWIDYGEVSEIEAWWKANGLIGACWHWRVPCVEGSDELHYTPGDGSVDAITGKRKTTTFSAVRATQEGTWENAVVKADLAKLSSYLKLLKDRGIPLIWRPLHEASGNIYKYANGKAWFWWGADGAEAYRKLWIYMFDYLQEAGIDNIIWVWTSQIGDEEFYPGDDYVDIIGRDLYPSAKDRDTQGFSLQQFKSLAETWPEKLVALSECGKREGVEWLEKISVQWEEGAKWLFFMPWYDFDRTRNPGSETFDETSHKYADISWWQDAVSQPYVLTRDKLPSFK